MMLKNCKYSRSVAWHMEMDRKWCCVIFQDGTKLMWQGIKIMIFYTNFTASNLTNATCYALLIDIVQQCITCCWSHWHFINENDTCEFAFFYDIFKTSWKSSFQLKIQHKPKTSGNKGHKQQKFNLPPCASKQLSITHRESYIEEMDYEFLAHWTFPFNASLHCYNIHL